MDGASTLSKSVGTSILETSSTHSLRRVDQNVTDRIIEPLTEESPGKENVGGVMETGGVGDRSDQNDFAITNSSPVPSSSQAHPLRRVEEQLPTRYLNLSQEPLTYMGKGRRGAFSIAREDFAVNDNQSSVDYHIPFIGNESFQGTGVGGVATTPIGKHDQQVDYPTTLSTATSSTSAADTPRANLSSNFTTVATAYSPGVEKMVHFKNGAPFETVYKAKPAPPPGYSFTSWPPHTDKIDWSMEDRDGVWAWYGSDKKV